MLFKEVLHHPLTGTANEVNLILFGRVSYFALKAATYANVDAVEGPEAAADRLERAPW